HTRRAASPSLRRQALRSPTVVSRGENLPPRYRALTEAAAVKVVKKQISQTQKQSRLIARTIIDHDQRRSYITRKR
ncbi:RlmF-related methyltransferase, partial [Salmonella enterica subsp. enterica serovar Infantis]